MQRIFSFRCSWASSLCSISTPSKITQIHFSTQITLLRFKAAHCCSLPPSPGFVIPSSVLCFCFHSLTHPHQSKPLSLGTNPPPEVRMHCYMLSALPSVQGVKNGTSPVRLQGARCRAAEPVNRKDGLLRRAAASTALQTGSAGRAPNILTRRSSFGQQGITASQGLEDMCPINACKASQY